MGIIFESLRQFWYFTGFANATWQNLVMILIGIVFITLAIKKEWEAAPARSDRIRNDHRQHSYVPGT